MAFVQSLFSTYEALVKSAKLLGSRVKNPLYIEDRQTAIARGKLVGGRQAQVEGYVTDIAVGAYDISELPTATIPIPSLAGVTMSIVSTSANDIAVTGSNARTVVIEYIEPVTEQLKWIEVNLNGATPVVVPVPIAFVSDFYVNNAASLDTTAEGDITIYNGTTVYGIIKAGNNKSLSCCRYVPKGKNLYITSLAVSSSTKAISVRLRANINDNIDIPVENWLFRSVAIMADSPTVIPFNPPIVIPEQHYIKTTAFVPSGASGGTVATGLTGWLEDKI